MSIQPKKFSDFLTSVNTNLTIPVKNYYWTEKHCKALLNNIALVGRNSKKDSHFMGSIVQTLYENQGTSEYVIIDGQQRVITMILIYIALYKLAKKMGKSNEKYQTIANDIFHSILMKKFGKTAGNLKAKENYQDVLKYIIVTDNIEITSDLEPFTKLIKSFKYITKKITEENFGAIRRGLSKLIFVEINLENKYVEYYNKLLSFNDTGNDEELKLHLRYNVKLGVKFTYPFLMKVYYDYDNKVISKAVFIEILLLIQMFVWRRIVANYPTTGLSKIFMNLHNLIDTKNYLHSVQKNLLHHPLPKDEEIRRILKEKDMYNIKQEYKIYLFEKLENYQNNKIKINWLDKANVEHIFPPYPVQQWETELGNEFREMQKYLHTLGNLTISDNAGAMENLYFTEKRDMNMGDKRQGYKYSKLWLNKSLQKLDKWDKKALEARTQELTERFLKIWQLPNIKGVTSNQAKSSTTGIIQRILSKIFGK